MNPLVFATSRCRYPTAETTDRDTELKELCLDVGASISHANREIMGKIATEKSCLPGPSPAKDRHLENRGTPSAILDRTTGPQELRGLKSYEQLLVFGNQ